MKLKIVEPYKSLNTMLEALDIQTYVLIIDYFSAPVSVSLAALYFVGVVSAKCFFIF